MLINLPGAVIFICTEAFDENWYVLRVRMGSEERVAAALTGRAFDDFLFPFVPTKSYPFRLKSNEGRGGREICSKPQICFEGYVFAKSKAEPGEFLRYTKPYLPSIPESHYFIYYGMDRQDIALRQHEKDVMAKLFDKAYNIGESHGFCEGDKVIVTDGPLLGLDGIIAKVDKRRRLAFVRTAIMGGIHEIQLMFEMLDENK